MFGRAAEVATYIRLQIERCVVVEVKKDKAYVNRYNFMSFPCSSFINRVKRIEIVY